MTTAELDALGAKWLADADAESAPQLTYGFPGATCISVNEEIAHGIPGTKRPAAGDMVNIDVSARVGKYSRRHGREFSSRAAGQPGQAYACAPRPVPHLRRSTSGSATGRAAQPHRLRGSGCRAQERVCTSFATCAAMASAAPCTKS